ncbi:MAG: bacillithiol biosynthesis BshC [Planctomycetota bacterium]
MARRKPDPERRERLLKELRPHWDSLELPLVARQAIERLEDPETRIVIAGQQPALWGGPLLGISKVLSVIALADQLEEAGIPTIPLFWVADDDHDGSELEPGTFCSGKTPGNPHVEGRRPLYDLRHRQLPDERLAALSDAIGSAPHAAPAMALAGSAISSGPAAEFISLLSLLLTETPWLPVVPRWFRNLQRPIVERAIRQSGQFRELVAEACREQETLGIPAPVPVPREEPIFVIDDDGLRRRPHQIERPITEILSADHGSISPDALLRTIVQDEVIDPAAVILGPTEFNYVIETRKVRQQWGLSQPLWLPRPALRPIDAERVEAIVAEGGERSRIVPGVTAADLMASEKATTEARQIAVQGSALIERIEELSVRDDANPALQRRARRLARTWRRQLAGLENSIERNLDGGIEARRQRVDVLLEQLFPGGGEPERNRNLIDLIAQQGLAVIRIMRQTLFKATRCWDGSVHEFDLNSAGESQSTFEPREEQHDGQR